MIIDFNISFIFRKKTLPKNNMETIYDNILTFVRFLRQQLIQLEKSPIKFFYYGFIAGIFFVMSFKSFKNIFLIVLIIYFLKQQNLRYNLDN